MRTLFLAPAFFVFSTAQSQVPTAIAYSSVDLLAAVNQPSAADAYVWLSADGLRLYYTKDIGAGNRLMLLTRPTLAAPFGAAVAVLPDYGADQTSGSLSADELTLWFSSSNSIMRTTRANTAAAFNAPETLTIVGIGNYPKSPTLTPDEEQMVLHTSNGLELLQRTGPAEYTVTGAVPSQPTDVSPAKMSHDGLRIYFSGQFGASYLPYRMSRASVSDAFSELEYLAGTEFTPGYRWTQPHLSADELQLAGTRGLNNQWQNNELFIAVGAGSEGLAPLWVPVTALCPNPASAQVTVSAAAGSFERVRVFDAQGRCMLDERSTAMPMQVDVSALPNGVYAVELMGAVRVVERLVVEH